MDSLLEIGKKVTSELMVVKKLKQLLIPTLNLGF